ncbi:hypothetical protein B0H12DRAFT_1229054 [Mycena haematopus]|nr:hypothetical protein B0H12DRAFT_1229054 [Mycena haematopus]
MASKRPLLERHNFLIAPLAPYVPDVILCRVDARTNLVSIVGALDSNLTRVSTRNLSRWLFLLARHVARARPIRPPAVYRPITVVAADVFVRLMDEIGPKSFPCDSPDPLPPGCYALFDANGDPYSYPYGFISPRPTFIHTHQTWDVPDDDPRAFYRLKKPVPEVLASQARERDRGLCCFTGRPSECTTWVIPPLLSSAVPHPGFSLERCLSVDNVFTISPDLLRAYTCNLLAVDPQDEYRVISFESFPGMPILQRLRSPPSSGRFWHSSLRWTLAVRFAGCDARFDGISAGKARDLLEELNFDLDHIPQGSKWSDPVAQEAIRTLFWAHLKSYVSVWDDTPPSPSHSSPSNSSDDADLVSNRTQPPTDHGLSLLSTFSWLFVHGWWFFVHYVWTQFFVFRRRSVD